VTAASISSTAWRNALFAVMATNGFAIATLLARTPALRDRLGVDPAGIGLMLAFFSGGSILGLATSGLLLHVLGARRLVVVAMPVVAAATLAIGVCTGALASFPATAAGAALFGAAVALSDVALNVEGSANERKAGRSVLPFVHAGFSFGTVLGAALGALAAAVGVDVLIHFCVAAVIVLVVAVVAPRWIPAAAAAPGAEPVAGRTAARRVWADPRTYVLGLVIFAFGYIEGAANDWLALGVVDERGFDQAGGALMLSAFTAAMTAGRFAGSRIIDRIGRQRTFIASALVAAAGLALLVFVPQTWAVVVGTIVWALGSSLGWPIGISAAGDDPASASMRVSAVSTLGYLAFFAGPPIVGLIANGIGILPALSVVFVLVAIALAVSPVVRPRPAAPAAVDAFGDPGTVA